MFYSITNVLFQGNYILILKFIDRFNIIILDVFLISNRFYTFFPYLRRYLTLSNKMVQSVERSAQEILELMIQAMLKILMKLKERQLQLDLQIVVKLHQSVVKEIEKIITEQLKKQIPEINIDSVKLPGHADRSQKYCIAFDPEGKLCQFDKIEKGELVFNPNDGQGEKLRIDGEKLNLSSDLNLKILTVGVLSKQQEQQIIKEFSEAAQRARSEGKSLEEAYVEVKQPGIQQGLDQIHQERLNYMEKINRTVEEHQRKVSHQLDQIDAKRKELDNQLKVGRITKKDYREQKKGLKHKEKKHLKSMKPVKKVYKDLDKELTKSLRKGCPDLSSKTLKNLSFGEKISLAKHFGSQPMDLHQLRDVIQTRGDQNAMKAFEKVSSREKELTIEESNHLTIEATLK